MWAGPNSNQLPQGWHSAAGDDGALLQRLSLFLFCGPMNSPMLTACPVLSSHSVLAGCDLSEVAPSTGFTFFFFNPTDASGGPHTLACAHQPR